jgi:hypothetical protein
VSSRNCSWRLHGQLRWWNCSSDSFKRQLQRWELLPPCHFLHLFHSPWHWTSFWQFLVP